MVETGSVRQKNSSNILIKNMFDAIVGAIAFYLIGFGFAFGNKTIERDDGTTHLHKFIGSDPAYFAASGFNEHPKDLYMAWIFQFSFAATSATIVSGSIAERTKLPSYMIFSALMTGFIYPVAVSWVWGGGWLAQNGFHDFAGSGCVHMVGGVAGLCGAAIIGPRHYFEKDPSKRKNF
jgi:Amt family ammonium transporter